MKSEEFFNKGDIYGTYFKGIQGIYVIQQPLFKKNGRDIYKIGFARDSLYKRIRDYKTAYGPIEFNIICLWEVPEGVVRERPLFARLTEARIHLTLKPELVMKNELTDRQEGEWFYDIKAIIGVIKKLQLEYTRDFPPEHNRPVEGADTWELYIDDEHDNIKPIDRKLATRDDVKSKVSKLEMKDPNREGKRVSKPNSKYQ